jgi:hypothetical protein
VTPRGSPADARRAGYGGSSTERGESGILAPPPSAAAVADKKRYDSGVYVRTSSDGKVWHQAQVGDRNVGYLFGQTMVVDKLKRMRADNKVAQRGKEAGEWNTYEITCASKNVTLWING